MLPKANRLNKEKDFKLVWGEGRSFFSKHVVIKTRKNDKNISRFGFIVSNKISKKSTKRNRVKRQIREIIRLNIKQIKPGFDCIVSTRQGILDRKYKEIDAEIIKILQKAGIIQ